MDLGEITGLFGRFAKEGKLLPGGRKRLYRTQPAVSLTIRKLEDSLEQTAVCAGGGAPGTPDGCGYAAAGVRRAAAESARRSEKRGWRSWKG